MDLNTLIDHITETTGTLVDSLCSGESVCQLGLRRSARLPVLTALHRELKRPLVLVTDRTDHALTLLEELKLWAPDVWQMLFPEPNPLFYENVSWGESTRRDRLLVLTTLASYHIPGAAPPTPAPMIIVPARALMTRTMPRGDFLRATRMIRLGQSVNLDQLLHTWVALGYQPVSTVIAPGEFARRGGILDLWPTAEPQPVRIELFGDEIETLRQFDPVTQRTLRKNRTAWQSADHIEKLYISPAREYLLPLDLAPPPDELYHSSDQQQFSEFDLPQLHRSETCLLDYLPPDSLVMIDNVAIAEDFVNEVEEQAVQMRQDYIQQGLLDENFPVPYVSWSEIIDLLAGFQVIELGPVTANLDPLGSQRGDNTGTGAGDESRLADRFVSGPRFGGRLKLVMEHMLERYRDGDPQVIVSRQAARLKELWEEQPLQAEDSPGQLRYQPGFIDGSLSEGWTFRTLKGPDLHLLTDGEIFGWLSPKPRYRRSERYKIAVEDPESAFSDLQSGDFVVHVDYGIGRFAGLVKRTVDNVEREYLRVEYDSEAELYVPVHQIDRLTRYIGPDNRNPRLSRLGGKEWRTTTEGVKKAVERVAQDLLELYARRSVITGYAFSPDTAWQQELEASFPYIETEDQIQVLGEVKRDMEAIRPMDRLICGDVGYGKTEVALRAAFKAVNDNKQVALLVPTTVLAQQHFQTFQERLAAYPVEVEMLSRFRTNQQQNEIIERLVDGRVDIVIGTHRLLSGDVQFRDLGLLIIDEEQRFGVTHKETLKQMRTEVDVLTMTATPIPRTLYMALSGVRDISTINTPPEERLPVITHVGPYSQRLVRQAILRELDRGGQVFFVHNRVQTIGAMRSHLERLVPEARLTVAHGQMPEKHLSERMKQFTAGEVDILLSTSIIESGLDIPSANTLIVDRADMFGLAQLYQLRGRVGRGAQRAYAYFFRHKRRSPSREGRQRLETIAENTQLGAGFSIAMRDLEIRGTGDILGTRQHGHIAAVGFHLYTRLLAGAVRRLRSDGGLPARMISQAALSEASAYVSMVNIELPLAVSIQSDYVSDRQTRIGLYRRLASMQNLEEVEAISEELEDRFGSYPETVDNLLYQTRLKILAEKAGLISLTSENGQFVMRYPDGELPESLPDLSPYVRTGKTALWMPFRELLDWQKPLLFVLKKLADPGRP